MRIALYARVSTDAQQAAGTVASQVELLRGAAARDGHTVIGEFVDDGYSGARLDRPALDRLRDAAQAGALDAMLCLCPDRLARSYAYQVLILEELEQFAVQVMFLEGPAVSADPQATLLIQVQGVISEYERAKIAERARRGKLHRARAGAVIFWRVPYGYRRILADGNGTLAHLEVYEPEALIVREIFALYVNGGRSVRQIAYELKDRSIPSPAGKPIWGTSTIHGVLRNEAYIGTVYYNRYESIDGNNRRGQRTRKTRQRERPREDWIAIPSPVIIDEDTHRHAQQVSLQNTRFNPRGVEPGAWLLRGLVTCGHCHVSCSCQKMRGRPGHFLHYYNCSHHDLLRAGSEENRCPERNIRADQLDAFVFEEIRQALIAPEQLIAGEHAVIANQPQTDDDLLAAQLHSLDRKLDGQDRERVRLLDAYQAELIDLDELTRRTRAIATRRSALAAERDTLREHRTELAQQNQLRHRLAGFAKHVIASIENLDFDGRQQLVRAVIEKVTVTGCRVEIHLKIPLTGNDDPTPNPEPPPHPPRPSTDNDLRSLDLDDVSLVGDPVNDGLREPRVGEYFGPLAERQVRGHDQRPAFVAFADDLEDELGGAVREGQIPQLVQEQDLDSGVAADDAGELFAAVGFLELGREAGEGGEADASALLAGAHAQGCGEHRFAGPALADQDHRLAVVDPGALGERGDRCLRDLGVLGEPEVL
jgi:site-specific DNA recombinase